MPTKAELQSLAVKAIVTFLQVFLSVMIADWAAGITGTEILSTAETAAVSGIGAVLSVIYNYLTNLGTRLEKAVELTEPNE